MSILFLGPLPPPVHGFSAINLAMLQRLRAAGDVVVFDRAHKATGPLKAARKLADWAWLVARYAFTLLTQKPTALYAGVSGGAGQLLDLPFFVLARMVSLPVFVHHHSFAYLNTPSAVARLTFSFLKRARHVVLCEDMAKRLSATYGLSPSQITVLSNVAFVPPIPATTFEAKQATGEDHLVTIGFLSNITEEKGIFEFFDVIRKAADSGLVFKARIAGPVSEEIKVRFETELAALPQAKHIGPVYGADKVAFLDGVDLLLFPTKYSNEAEPVTILEALQSGAKVVATTRGCIGGMLPDQCGAAIGAAEFSSVAISAINSLLAQTAEARMSGKAHTKAQFAQLYQRSSSQLEHLVQRIVTTTA